MKISPTMIRKNQGATYKPRTTAGTTNTRSKMTAKSFVFFGLIGQVVPFVASLPARKYDMQSPQAAARLFASVSTDYRKQRFRPTLWDLQLFAAAVFTREAHE